MKTSTFWIITGSILAVVLLGLGAWLFAVGFFQVPVVVSPESNNDNQAGQTVSDGTITLAYASDFGLAVTKQQILVASYIPPCDDDFKYCFYYQGDAYKGTNFESAGLRIQKRTDLTAERACLDTPPEGFNASTVPNKTASANTYSTSLFSNIGQGGAGHLSNGLLYRLYVRDSNACYEFETRVGQSQFANYPAGAIKEFTSQHQADINAKLEQLLSKVSLSGGQGNLFSLNSPSPTASAGCYVGGCSSEICSDKQNAVSACIYQAQFACYKTATCERQANGQCGWTQTPQLTSCLSQNR